MSLGRQSLLFVRIHEGSIDDVKLGLVDNDAYDYGT